MKQTNVSCLAQPLPKNGTSKQDMDSRDGVLPQRRKLPKNGWVWASRVSIRPNGPNMIFGIAMDVKFILRPLGRSHCPRMY